MSLRGSPMMYVFYETNQLTKTRELFESVIGLPVIEIEPHMPHHHHGVIKYDAGNVILSLNLSGPGLFPKDTSDGLTTVFKGAPAWPVERLRDNPELVTLHDGGLITDNHGHHFMFRAASDGDAARPNRPVVEEFRLKVRDLADSVSFYEDILGLEPLDRSEDTARFTTGGIILTLERDPIAPDGQGIRHSTYLLVFYSSNIEEMYSALAKRGLEFKSPRVDYNEVGGTVRFDDPSGHRYCLYVPSEECLSWESGPKVSEIAASYAMAR